MTRFKKALIIYASALTFVIVALIGILALFLDTYEKNLPEKAAEKYISELDDEKITQIIQTQFGDQLVFDTAADILHSDAFTGELKTSKLAKEYTFDAPVYRIISPLGDIGKFSLSPSTKKALFGLTKWELANEILYEEVLGTPMDYTICVKSGSELYINGIKADSKYLTEEDSDYDGKVLLSSDVKCDVYNIPGIYTKPKISIISNDQSEEFDDINSSRFDYFALSDKHIKITLPSDATLTISGTVANEKNAVKGDILTAVSIFEQNIPESLPRMLSYTVYCDDDMPQISVTLNGKELSPMENENEFIYLYSDDAMYSVKAILPRGAELYINGVKAENEYSTGNCDFIGIADAKKYIANMSSGTAWEVGGLLCPPKVTAVMNDKELIPCYNKNENGSVYIEFYGESVEPTAAEKIAAEKFTHRYFKYTVNGAVGLEENLSELLAMMKSGSSAYKKMDNSRHSFEFVNQFKYTVNALEAKNFIELGNNAFRCDVDFDVRLKFYNGEKIYAGVLSIIAIKDNDGYLICDLVLDSENES